MIEKGKHTGFEANVFLQKTLASNAPTINLVEIIRLFRQFAVLAVLTDKILTFYHIINKVVPNFVKRFVHFDNTKFQQA